MTWRINVTYHAVIGRPKNITGTLSAFDSKRQTDTRCSRCQTPPKRQTDRHQESNLVHFILKI